MIFNIELYCAPKIVAYFNEGRATVSSVWRHYAHHPHAHPCVQDRFERVPLLFKKLFSFSVFQSVMIYAKSTGEQFIHRFQGTKKKGVDHQSGFNTVNGLKLVLLHFNRSNLHIWNKTWHTFVENITLLGNDKSKVTIKEYQKFNIRPKYYIPQFQIKSKSYFWLTFINHAKSEANPALQCFFF